MNTKKTSTGKKKTVAAESPDTGPPAEPAEAKVETPKPRPSTERAEAADDATVDARPAEDTKTDAVPAEPPLSRRIPGRAMGWLALILALVALGGTSYLAYQGWRRGVSEAEDAQALAQTNSTLDTTRRSLASLEQRLATLAAKDVASVTELQTAERKLDQRVGQLESLPGRVGNLEGAVASLQGISSGARDTFLLEEAEYYMQIANAQLQLAGNPHLAGLALRFADERLLQLADPALTDVRRALSDELRALDAMGKPDIEGVTLTLASLAGVVESLPLREEVRASGDATVDIDPELSGFDRAWATLKRTAGDIISVRRTDEAAAPLTAPDSVYFLRANLALQFQIARLALLRNEQAVFDQSLDDASAWLNRYYDTGTAPVQSALETIGELREGLFAVSIPDISRSLSLLRQRAALSDSAPLPETEPDR